jgi:hypothetical protein
MNKPIISEEVYRFEKKFNARVRPSNMRTAEPLYYNLLDRIDDQDYSKTTFNTRVVPAVDITMSEDCFEDLLDAVEFMDSAEWRHQEYMRSKMGSNWLNKLLSIQDRNIREEYLRDSNPAVQKAWEQYQMLLKLVD